MNGGKENIVKEPDAVDEMKRLEAVTDRLIKTVSELRRENAGLREQVADLNRRINKMKELLSGCL